ncbi:MAG: hypothetical protein NT154_00705 [Verrucomicrobia bacterium]|nr:hypothetical protein [Verrucomicrobiota bacterium]
MRSLLFDENLPHVPSLQAGLPITHASDLGSRPADSRLWAYTSSKNGELSAVSADGKLVNDWSI